MCYVAHILQQWAREARGGQHASLGARRSQEVVDHIEVVDVKAEEVVADVLVTRMTSYKRILRYLSL